MWLKPEEAGEGKERRQSWGSRKAKEEKSNPLKGVGWDCSLDVKIQYWG